MTRDLYELLGVQRDATAEEIHAAFRALSKLHHPDIGGDPEEFKAMKLADEVLTDPERRAKYDTTGDTGNDGGPERLKADALATLASVLGIAIEMQNPVFGNQNLINDMRQILETKKLEVVADKSRFKSTVDKLQKIKDRITVKSGENHLAAVLESQIGKHNFNIGQADRAIEVATVALADLERYVFELDQTPPPLVLSDLLKQYHNTFPNQFFGPGT